MRRKIILTVFGVLLLFSQACLAQAPRQIAGFVLGGNFSDFKEKLRMETVLPIRYREYLKEVEIKPIEGFKSGLVWFGTCNEPNRIVRIKLKYADSSKKFYSKLLERFKQRFGEPDEWRGDPFHVVIAWKWSFIDSNRNPISMILQHNTLDAEEKKGNALKMTLTDLINQEHLCHEKKYPREGQARKKRRKRARGKGVNWDLFVPR
jgi:hypothetical protein